MAKSKQRLQAILLRRQGESIKHIAKMLAVSSGSASHWVRDIPLSKKQRDNLAAAMIAGGHKGRLIGARVNKEKRLSRICECNNLASQRIRRLTNDTLFFLGLGLYWGEGSKKDSGSLSVANSDPFILRIAMRWFVECFGIERSRFHPRIFINDLHRDRSEKLLRYWSRELSLPRNQFANTVFVPRGRKVYENRDTYYGVVALHVRKGTDVRYQVLALLERLGALGSIAGVVQESERGTHKP